jgi:benzoate-CoA ligase
MSPKHETTKDDGAAEKENDEKTPARTADYKTDIDLPENFNAVSALLDDHVREGRGSRTAIEYGEDKIFYNQLLRYVNKTGNSFKELGVEIENRVAILLPDEPAFFYSYLGAMKIGAIPIPFNTMLTPKDYYYMIKDSRAKILVTSPELYDNVRPILGGARYLKRIVIVGDIPDVGDLVHFTDLMKRTSDRLECEEVSSQDVALWLYSSGSTGAPKGTIHLHQDIIFTTDLYAKHILEMDESSRCFSASKLFFAYGLGNSLHFPLRFGATSILYPGRPKPEAVFEVLEKRRPTHFFGVPTLYAAMLNHPGAEKHDLSHLKFCVSAGEALQPVIFKRWQETFKQEIIEGIGSTELLHIFISNRKNQARPGSSGVLVPGYEAKIVDSEGKEVPLGQEGNLIVRGKSSAPFYWNKLEKTRKTMIGEWLHTGDIYNKDEDGYFWYSGRSDDMLKVGGIWVSPVEVENVLMEHPAVFEVAVVGVPDEKGLIKPKAYVILNAGREPSEELARDLQEHVKRRTAPYKYPRWVEFVKELPKTATGKIQRFKLRKTCE